MPRPLDRRALITGAASLTLGAALLPRRGWSASETRLGEATVLTLSDGNLTLPADFISAPMPQEEMRALMVANGRDPDAPYTPPCNVTLLRHGPRLVLFDTGAGPGFQDSAGKLADALDAAGIDPGDVTDVVFTHGHPDHLWGVLDDFDEPLFYNARHMIGLVERDYWADPDTVDAIGEARASMAVGAARRIDMLGDALETFADGDEVLPGITALMTPGHTPGHMSFLLHSGAEAALVLGDAIGNDLVGFARPEWPSGSDQDQPLAAATRQRLLDRITADDLTVAGFHLGGGGIGRVEKAASGYRFLPGA